MISQPNKLPNPEAIFKLFNTQIEEGYSIEDMESCRYQFLATNESNRIVEYLIDNYSLCPWIIVDTILMIYDDPSICSIIEFPYTALIKSFNKISLIESLCTERIAIYLNLLYRISWSIIPSSTPSSSINTSNSIYLKSLTSLLGFKGCLKVFENREVWGLNRKRVGVIHPDDNVIKLIMKIRQELDITQINRTRQEIQKNTRGYTPNTSSTDKDGNEEKQNNNDEFIDGRSINYSHVQTVLILGQISDSYRLPFFLDGPLSLFNVFDPKEKLPKSSIDSFSILEDDLYSFVIKLICNQTIKDNFCAVIENVYSQDRTKTQYEAEDNCSDSFCYGLTVILMKVANGLFKNPSFIETIGEKKFSTFCFFNLSRMLEISLLKVIYTLKMNRENRNLAVWISKHHELIQTYFNFVYELIDQRKDEVFSPLVEAYRNCTSTNSPSAGIPIQERVSVNDQTGGQTGGQSNGQDMSHCISALNISNSPNMSPSMDSNIETSQSFESFAGIIDFSFNDKKAMKIDEILADNSFLNTILSFQAETATQKISRSIVTLISAILIYKNTFKSTCVDILFRASIPIQNETLIKRLIVQYSDRNSDSIMQTRYVLHDLLKFVKTDVSRDSLRMMSLCLGSFEEQVSKIFNLITEINQYKQKSNRLQLLLSPVVSGANGDNNDESDEEPGQIFPARQLDILALMNDQQLNRAIESMGLANSMDTFKLLIKFRNDPIKGKICFRLFKNSRKQKETEEIFKSNILFVTKLLEFLKSFTSINNKLFLNKNVFFRMFSIINSVLNLLVGKKSLEIKMENKESYNFHPKEILSIVELIILNVLRNNQKLIQGSGIDTGLLDKAIKLSKSRNLLKEGEIESLKYILEVLKESTKIDNETSEEAPEEFLDPLTYLLMDNPVILLTSKVTIDRSTFNQIMLNDQIDPFSRAPLDDSLVIDNIELKERIEKFKSGKN